MVQGSEGGGAGELPELVPMRQVLVVIIVDNGSVPEAVGTHRRVLIIVTLVGIIVVMPIPISVQPVGDVIFKFLEKKSTIENGVKDTHFP